MYVNSQSKCDSREGEMAGICKRGNEPSVSIICRGFLDQLRTGQFLKIYSAPWSKEVNTPTKMRFINPLRYELHVCCNNNLSCTVAFRNLSSLLSGIFKALEQVLSKHSHITVLLYPLLYLVMHVFINFVSINPQATNVIYIYIYIYMEHLFLMFLDHTQRRSTVGRTPLDE